MVIALKELSIRGDFRTTVEYLVKLLETEKFQTNTINTGWLDHLISEKVQTFQSSLERLSDGGLLLALDGSSYTTYMREEVSSYRIVIGNKTCVFEKENDPTALRAPSTGKLINFLVEDGGHVFTGDVYAEIEVMKMVMELKVEENGCVHYVKRPGVSLDAGCIIAHLKLDDPSRVQRVSTE
ncbi:hypothetical protein NP493_691g01020 [Ridgeia piscesae]|uniref:Lipoyl-binding domain-containing protein n=1 Tax=Ridgeia piscesae TaxID=27915 RepID=A0AAD9KSN0_RIDPI|nr:hypothetical protein NP493_691g01020 [Ridgeia piscesae]